jgi:hypothetical protein
MLKCFERESFVENKIPNLRYSSNQSELDSNGWKAIKKVRAFNRQHYTSFGFFEPKANGYENSKPNRAERERYRDLDAKEQKGGAEYCYSMGRTNGSCSVDHATSLRNRFEGR